MCCSTQWRSIFRPLRLRSSRLNSGGVSDTNGESTAEDKLVLPVVSAVVRYEICHNPLITRISATVKATRKLKQGVLKATGLNLGCEVGKGRTKPHMSDRTTSRGPCKMSAVRQPAGKSKRAGKATSHSIIHVLTIVEGLGIAKAYSRLSFKATYFAERRGELPHDAVAVLCQSFSSERGLEQQYLGQAYLALHPSTS